MTYAFHPEARLEYREAASFYASRHSGLGAAFTLEVEATIERILEAPQLTGGKRIIRCTSRRRKGQLIPVLPSQ